MANNVYANGVLIATETGGTIHIVGDSMGARVLSGYLAHGVPGLRGVADGDVITEERVLYPPDDPLFGLALLDQFDELGWTVRAEGGGAKAFCPTGPGGGIDNSCSPGGGGGAAVADDPSASVNKNGDPTIITHGPNNVLLVSKHGYITSVEFKLDGWANAHNDYYKGKPTPQNYQLRGIIKAIEACANGKYDEMESSFPEIFKTKPEDYKSDSFKSAYDIWQKLQDLKQINYYESKTGYAGGSDDKPTGQTLTAAGLVDASGWKQTSGSLGTEKGGTYVDQNGYKYYVKTPDDPGRAHNEVLAVRLAQVAGSYVKPTLLVDVGGGKIGVASRWLDGEPIDYHSAAGKDQLSEDFATQAWLANWDVAGAGMENTMIIDGNPVCIDYGGALTYHAHGGGGQKPFGPKADEFDTMRNASINPNSHKMYGDMTPEQLHASAEGLKKIDLQEVFDTIDVYHQGDEVQKLALYNTLLARREDILARVAKLKPLAPPPLGKGPAAPQPSPPHQPPPPPDATPAVKPTAAANPDAIKGMVLPSKPTYKAVNSYTKKLDALEAAANTGDIEKVKGVYVNMEITGHYAKMMQTYKTQLLEAMAGGAKPQADTPPKGATPAKDTNNKPVAPQPKPTPIKAPPPPPKIEPDKFPEKPVFKSSQAANVESNMKQVAEALAHAGKGDLDALTGMQLNPSGVLKSWHAKLVEELSNQLNPPKPPVHLDTDYAELAHGIKVKASDSAATIGYWNVVDDVGGLPSGLPKGEWATPTLQTAMHFAGNKAYAKLPHTVQQEIKDYTGGGYTPKNHALRHGKQSHDAEVAAMSILHGGIKLTTGTLLSRKYTPNDYDKHVQQLKSAIGKVVSDKGILSTSTDKDVWSGTIHMHLTVGPGVTGLPAGKFSSHKPEKEVLFAPNQRVLLQSVSHESGVTVVRGTILPTHHNQYP